MTQQISKKQVLRADEIEELNFDRLIHVKPVSGYKASMVILRVDKGGISPWHKHAFEQFDYVIEGKYRIKIEDNEYFLEAGDVVVIPPAVPHNIEALEDSRHIEFFSPALPKRLIESWIER